MSVEDAEAWKEKNEAYRKRKIARNRARKKRTKLEQSVEYAWDNGGRPSRHSAYENLIPAWQNALKRFAQNVIELHERGEW